MYNPLSGIFGNKENDFSELFAFTIYYYHDFFKWVLDKCQISDNCEIETIFTEKNLDSQENRIDIYLLLDNGFIIGIENKKSAGFTHKQIERYMASSHFRDKTKSRLILLTPSRYQIDKSLYNKSLIMIKYKDVVERLIITCNGNKYIDDLIKYYSEVEMSPINENEILSMIYYFDGNKKLDTALYDCRKKNDWTIENGSGSYKLFGRYYGKYLFYFGYRFNSNWYLNYELLNTKPECIVYLREYSEKLVFNELLDDLRIKVEKMAKEMNLIDNTKCEFLNGEIKLIIRKNIECFANQDISAITAWFISIDKILTMHFS